MTYYIYIISYETGLNDTLACFRNN